MLESESVVELQPIDRRTRFRDSVWVVTVLLVLVIVGVPWLLRVLEVNLAATVWGLLAFSGAYAAARGLPSEAAEGADESLVIVALHILGLLTLAVAWRFSGGLQNPMLLAAFTLPILAGGLPGVRWLPYLSAALSIVIVGLVALIDSPDLRWHAVQVGLPLEGLANLMDKYQLAGVRPFPAFMQPVSAQVVALTAFAGVMIAFAVTVDSFAAALRHEEERAASTARTSSRHSDFLVDVLSGSPWPAVLIAEATGHISAVSRSFREHFWIDVEQFDGKSVTEILHFSYPDVVDAHIQKADGEPILVECSIGSERRFLRISARRLLVAGFQWVFVELLDDTSHVVSTIAHNASDAATVVLDDNERIICLYGSASQILGPSGRLGTPASSAFENSDPAFAWWALGVQKSRRLKVLLAGVPFKVYCRASAMPGQAHQFTVITLQRSPETA